MTDHLLSIAVSLGALIGPSLGASFGPTTDPSLGNVSFGLGAFASLALLCVLAFKARHLAAGFVLLAVGATLAWTALATAYYADFGIQPRWLSALEVLRFLLWFVFLASPLLRGEALPRLGSPAPVLVAGALAAACAAVASIPLWSEAISTADVPTLKPVVGLTGAVAGLLATEILYRNASLDQRWRIKFLCIATGIMFVYDLFMYADAALFGTVDPALQEARGAIQAICIPLLAIAAARAEIWRTNIVMSRKLVMGSTTLIASGVYLSLAAAAGFVLRQAGGVRGDVVQIVFLVGALAVLAVILFSGTYWAHVRIFVNRHFFRHKYDWREEWLRFMATLGSGGETPLEERCVKAIADIVGSPGGTMILMEADHAHHAATWNFEVPELSAERAYSFGAKLKESQAVIDLEQLRAGAEVQGGDVVPKELLDRKRAWLVVPLWHRRILGFVILEQPRAARELGWEDYDLLGVVGRQAANYLAEHRAQEALEAAREFEIFNRRFAFVVHDVKNLVSQLSVLCSNFEKHGHRQEFRDDVVETLKDAGDSMSRLMERIGVVRAVEAPKASVALRPIIEKIVTAMPAQAPGLKVECEPRDLAVTGDPDRIEAIIAHLFQNAVEAVKDRGTVKITLRDDGRFAILDVSDDGPGMAREFVQRELFKPFQSTKTRGMGIGVYQCREYAREFGGNLEAITALGKGTTMRITLPVAKAS